MVGEKCPEYLYDPKVAKRIYDSLGEKIKFIVTLRHPAQRAFSHYRHNLNMLRESRSFEEALAEEAKQMGEEKWIAPPYGYIGRGLYAKQIKTYFQYFSPKQFLFIDFEKEVLGDQRMLVLKLFHFLGVKPILPKGLPFKAGHPKLEGLTVEYVKHSTPEKSFVEVKRAKKTVKKLLRFNEKTPSNKIFHPSTALINFAKSFAQNKPAKSQLSPQEASRINQLYFGNELEELENLIDFNTTHWT